MDKCKFCGSEALAIHTIGGRERTDRRRAEFCADCGRDQAEPTPAEISLLAGAVSRLSNLMEGGKA